MKSTNPVRQRLLLCAVLFASLVPPSRAQIFTFQVGPTTAPPIPLVNHGDVWNFYKPTNGEPVVDWQTVPDSSLGAAWGSGPGGFGYGDPRIVGENTTLSDMTNRYTTFYIRKSFEIANAVDPAQRLELIVDYDDGYVAYLDGMELTRANLTNGPGTTVVFNATTGGASHEASCCNAPTNSPSHLDLGPAGNRLGAGTHTLALHGVNQVVSSSDFHLIADLALSGTQVSPTSGRFFTLVNTNVVVLSGTNTLAGSTRVVVNGVEAAFNPLAGTWSKTQSLRPGVNHLFIAALDAAGAILSATNRDVIYEASSTTVGGALADNTSWTSAMGIIRVTSDVVVPSGVTLSIGPGVVVLLGSGVSIRATAGGTIDAAGTEADPDFFLPMDGTTAWGSLNATGAGASLSVRHLETTAGSITFNTLASGLIEDAYLHDRPSIITANSSGFITIRRVHVKNYEETIFNSGTIILAEDNLYEDLTAANSDCLEIQGGPPGSIIRRCTFRRSSGSNSDAVDCNGTSGTLMESLLIHDISDKGISMGASGAGGAPDFGMVITNCLIYRVDTGIAVKDNGTASLFDTTLSASPFGMRLYQKFATPIGGGHVTNAFNNLVWGNTVSLALTEGATVVLDYSDVQGTNWPGTGNLSVDPLFVNPAADDFRLGAGSPAIGAGQGGADMGVHFPVGGLPSDPTLLAANADGTNQLRLWWQEDADNEAGFAIERSTDASNWQALDAVGANVTNFTDSSALIDRLYFYRVRATNASGASRFSNLAGAIRQMPMTLVCGTLAANTVWSPANGMILVCSNVIVPANISLLLQAGAVVKLTNNASLIARAGGTIRLEGTEGSRVVVQRWNPPNNWGEIRADGAGASLVIRYADISGGQTTVYNGADGLFEDSYFHNFHQQGAGTTLNQPIVLTQFPRQSIMRRCHLNDYYEMLWRHGLNMIEDSLFEHMVGDALDFDAAKPGSIVRHCTFRHGDVSNVDGLDIGNDGAITSSDVLITDCLMYDFAFDKGVSIGEGSTNIVVTNCLIYGCDSGVAVKDSSIAQVFGCTFVENDFGFKNFNKADPASPTGGGRITNSWNNILWNNITNISLLNGSTLVADYSDFGGTNYAGTGNIDADPLFLLPAQRDYRLLDNSPCIGAGRDGQSMGAHYPVGAPMAPSHPTIQSIQVSGGTAVVRFWADYERTYSLLSAEALSGGTWSKVADVPTGVEPRLLSITNAIAPNNRFYRLVTP